MSTFAIGEQVEKTADNREFGTVVAAFLAVGGSFGYAADTKGYGALQFFTGENLTFTLARRGAA